MHRFDKTQQGHRKGALPIGVSRRNHREIRRRMRNNEQTRRKLRVLANPIGRREPATHNIYYASGTVLYYARTLRNEFDARNLQ